ncbi:MAG: hypothetical protein ABMB14_15055, partial [Myxococcota bacterium]
STVDEPAFEEAIADVDARDGVVWAVSYDTLGRWDATAGWTLVPLPEASWSPTGLVARRDGTAAVLTDRQGIDDCYTDCGPSATEILALWDGVGWDVYIQEPTASFSDLTELADGTLVAVGVGGRVASWNGTGWAEEHGGEVGSLRSVDDDGAGLIAVGDDGLVVRGTLGALVVEDSGEALDRVAVEPDGTAWAIGWAGARVDDGTGWAPVSLPPGQFHGVDATVDGAYLLGIDAGGVVAAGEPDAIEVVWHAPSVYWVRDVWLDGDGGAWLAAYSGPGRWDASGLTTWSLAGDPYEGPRGLGAITGTGPTDVIAGGDDGLYGYDGTGWTRTWTSEDATVWDVAASPDGAAFASVNRYLPDETMVPALLVRDGDGWVDDLAPIPADTRTLIALVAFAADEVYALGWDRSALLRWDGAQWIDLTGDLGEGFTALWGRSGTDLYLGSGEADVGGKLLRWDGVALTEVAGGPPNVTALSGDATVLIAAGTDGYGEAYAPVVSLFEDGGWTELFRAEASMAVGARDGELVVTGDADGWRGPAAAY